MTKIQPCSTCENEREMELVTSTETITIKGKLVPFEAEYYRCTVCGTEIEEPGQLDRNLDSARDAYDRLYATPSPEELVALREKYGASQKAFGTLLGFGESTMNTYEQGEIPNSTNRVLLRLAEDPVVFQKMYTMNKEKIGAIQRRRIEASPGYQEVYSCAEIFRETTVVTEPPVWGQSHPVPTQQVETTELQIGVA